MNVSGWDINHGQGHGSMLYAMAQHYLLSGDKAWLTEHLPSFKAAARWIVRERKQWVDKVGPEAWSSGLIPPCELGDYADWLSLYQTNVFYWRGLNSAALAIAEVDAEAGPVSQRGRTIPPGDSPGGRSFRGAVARGAGERRNLPSSFAPQPYLRGWRRFSTRSAQAMPAQLVGQRRRRGGAGVGRVAGRTTRVWTKHSTCWKTWRT